MVFLLLRVVAIGLFRTVMVNLILNLVKRYVLTESVKEKLWTPIRRLL